MADPLTMPDVVIVTGTGTEVGKTMTTAALTVLLRRRGLSVAVVKPTQTGLAHGHPGDVDVVQHLVGNDPDVTFHEFVRLRDPLAPDTAARRQGASLPPVADHARRIALLARTTDIVLVEGAGGLLVRLDDHGATLADLGKALLHEEVSTAYALVVSAGLGTLNHTALTVEALRARDLPLLGLVVGSWPRQPGLAERCNLTDLTTVAQAPVLGCLPEGVGALEPSMFRQGASTWLSV